MPVKEEEEDIYNKQVCVFLGAFANSRKATITIVIYVRPHRATRLSLDGFV